MSKDSRHSSAARVLAIHRVSRFARTGHLLARGVAVRDRSVAASASQPSISAQPRDSGNFGYGVMLPFHHGWLFTQCTPRSTLTNKVKEKSPEAQVASSTTLFCFG